MTRSPLWPSSAPPAVPAAIATSTGASVTCLVTESDAVDDDLSASGQDNAQGDGQSFSEEQPPPDDVDDGDVDEDIPMDDSGDQVDVLPDQSGEGRVRGERIGSLIQ